jgi:probable F420-dependent oxidoreductase
MTSSDRPIRIGVQLQPQHTSDYTNLRDAVRRCEDIGVDVAFNWDHFFPLYGDPDGAHYECWTMLGAWAEQTSRIELGALVTCNSYRNPELLADMARTVDHISGGRVILGIGAGWFERDYDEYGYTFATAPDRLRELGAALPRITSRLGRLNPAPIGTVPIMIGGKGPKVTLRLTAQHAAIWHGFGAPEEWAASSAILDDWCEQLGRDPGEIERSVTVQPAYADRTDDFVKAGATLLVANIDGPGFDLSQVEQLVRYRDAQ